MTPICPEFIDLINMPPSDTEPDECYLNKLRIMDTEERIKKLSELNYTDQLKIARTHKVCLMLNHKNNCILKC